MMKKIIPLVLVSFSCFYSSALRGQVNKNEIGAWYMYFWNTQIKQGPWGFQGDVQHRNWNTIGDLEQLLLRGGFTYTPKKANIKFTLGYGNIQTGTFGLSKDKSTEHRIYQEALFPQKIGERFYLNHRLRYEQRFVENQDLRTRYRYNMFVNVPLNNKKITDNTFYLALYNELFINGQRKITTNKTVALFDRNRIYGALGYAIKKQMKVQLGMMRQTTDALGKNQMQLSFHHTF